MPFLIVILSVYGKKGENPYQGRQTKKKKKTKKQNKINFSTFVETLKINQKIRKDSATHSISTMRSQN